MPIPNNLRVSILVDYAHEPESMKRLMETLIDFRRRLFFDKIIHIISCDGAGRDDWKKPVMGIISYTNADFSVITTDNYDKNDNPESILNMLSQDFVKGTELKNIEDFNGSQKYYKVVNRQEAFETANQIASLYAKYAKQNTDEIKVLIVTTGVGSEQLMIQPEGPRVRDERIELKKTWQKFII